MKRVAGLALIVLSFITVVIPIICEQSVVYASKTRGHFVTVPHNEFSVVFPNKYYKKNSFANGKETVLFENVKEANEPYYLRAEFIDGINRAHWVTNFKSILEEYAYLSGIKNLLTVSVSEQKIGLVGEYSGLAGPGEQLKMYGKIIVGEYSLLGILTIEAFNRAMSQGVADFISSVERK